MSDINAAIGTVQLKDLNIFQTLEKNYVKFMTINLKISKFKVLENDYNSVCPHIYIIRIHNLKHKEKLRKELLKKGIQTGIHYYPNYKYKKYKAPKRKFPNTEKIYQEILTLPLHPDLNKRLVSFISDQVIKLSKQDIYLRKN